MATSPVNLLSGTSEQYLQVSFVTLSSLCSYENFGAYNHFLKVVTLRVSLFIYMLDLFTTLK